MPGWHAATQDLQKAGKLQTVGIIQEQHPDRARLFMQWKQMDWPIMVDSLDLLGVKVVPITLLIDEMGIIRFKGDAKHLDAFLALEPPEPMPSPRSLSVALADGPTSSSPSARRDFVDQLFLWGGEGRLDEVIDGYERLLPDIDDDGETHFRLGVAYRRRADSGGSRPGDFRRAVEHWGRALDTDPNQYIWRRRIQQYGPRLDKPYPFYDWVDLARQEILARGETPSTLRVEPRGAELAQPSERFVPSEAPSPPRNADRIRRDKEGFVEIETTVVPTSIKPGTSARLHLAMRPGNKVRSHWNNEAEDLMVWLEPPAGWKIDTHHLSVANPPQVVSDEVRHLELEVQSPADAQGSVNLTGYALYYVCEDAQGVCLYRRQDISVPLTVAD